MTHSTGATTAAQGGVSTRCSTTSQPHRNDNDSGGKSQAQHRRRVGSAAATAQGGVSTRLTAVACYQSGSSSLKCTLNFNASRRDDTLDRRRFRGGSVDDDAFCNDGGAERCIDVMLNHKSTASQRRWQQGVDDTLDRFAARIGTAAGQK
jgi:hypothetical protein